MDRRLWESEEDNIITQLVKVHGTKKWPVVSEELGRDGRFKRTGKQCRERWHNHLSPDISRGKWSEEDQEKLFLAHRDHGNRWKNISKLFQGRTDNAIKNHFYSTLRKSLRRINKLHGEKNSTLKMRLIKPHVLSEILSDVNLTEMIFTMGRIKPSKHNYLPAFEDSLIFDGIFDKLMAINADYEQKKKIKSELKKKGKNNMSPTVQSNTLSEKESEKTFTFFSFPKKISPLFEVSKINKEITKRKIKRKRNRCHISKETHSHYLSKSQRIKKKINYYSLHQGIELKEFKSKAHSYKKEDQYSHKETHKQLYGQKDQQVFVDRNITNDQNIDDQRVQVSSLQQILEEQQPIEQHQAFRFNEKSSIMEHSCIGFQFHDSKPFFSDFDIKYPSPSFAKRNEDLTISGSHLKIMNSPHYFKHHLTPGFDCGDQRVSDHEYVHQEVKIDFDLGFALRDADQQ